MKLLYKGGGGITCIIQDGQVWERAAVNISVVMGTLPPKAIAEMRARGKSAIPTGKDLPFFACGISSVIHPVRILAESSIQIISDDIKLF